MPLFVRKFIVDFVEGAVLGIFALNLFLPSNTDEAKAQAAIVGAGLLSAGIAAARRNAPAAFLWFREQLGVAPEGK